jgi:dTDP-4-amino-4,6-dideoxygalactose transaminase
LKKINVTRSSMPSFEEYISEIEPLWESRWLSNRGAIHRKFEEQLCKYLDVRRVCLFANGHTGLEVPIGAFGLRGEVITTPFTFCSTTHSIVRNGLTPVFCDVNDRDFTLDADQIERYINEKTCAIFATHVYGLVCEVERIQSIADKYHLRVLYDAAHAFGIKKDGVGIGNFGDMTMFSCHATKVFHTIEGGITVVNDDSISEKLDMLTNFGISGEENVKYVGSNARMNEFEAAMGVCNLRHIDEMIAKRKTAADRYSERLDGVKGIRLVLPQAGITCNYTYYPVFFDGYKETRDEIHDKLAKENIFARKYFYPLVSELDCYAEAYGTTAALTPVAKHASEHVLTLPMYADLTVADVDRICDIILK